MSSETVRHSRCQLSGGVRISCVKAFLILLSVGLGVLAAHEHYERGRADKAIAYAETMRNAATESRDKNSDYYQRELAEAKRVAGVQETNLRYERESLAMELESAKRKIALLTSQLASAGSRDTAPSPAPVVQYRAVPVPVDPLARYYRKSDPIEERLGNIEYELQRQANAERLSKFIEGFNRR